MTTQNSIGLTDLSVTGADVAFIMNNADVVQQELIFQQTELALNSKTGSLNTLKSVWFNKLKLKSKISGIDASGFQIEIYLTQALFTNAKGKTYYTHDYKGTVPPSAIKISKPFKIPLIAPVSDFALPLDSNDDLVANYKAPSTATANFANYKEKYGSHYQIWTSGPDLTLSIANNSEKPQSGFDDADWKALLSTVTQVLSEQSKSNGIGGLFYSIINTQNNATSSDLSTTLGIYSEGPKHLKSFTLVGKDDAPALLVVGFSYDAAVGDLEQDFANFSLSSTDNLSYFVVGKPIFYDYWLTAITAYCSPALEFYAQPITVETVLGMSIGRGKKNLSPISYEQFKTANDGIFYSDSAARTEKMYESHSFGKPPFVTHNVIDGNITTTSWLTLKLRPKSGAQGFFDAICLDGKVIIDVNYDSSFSDSEHFTSTFSWNAMLSLSESATAGDIFLVYERDKATYPILPDDGGHTDFWNVNNDYGVPRFIPTYMEPEIATRIELLFGLLSNSYAMPFQQECTYDTVRANNSANLIINLGFIIPTT